MNLLLTRCRHTNTVVTQARVGARPPITGHTDTLSPLQVDAAHGRALGSRPEPAARDNRRHRAGPGSGRGAGPGTSTALGAPGVTPPKGDAHPRNVLAAKGAPNLPRPTRAPSALPGKVPAPSNA